MRLVEGGDLRKLIDREGPLPPVRAIALLGQVAEALDAAHAAGIVHRDVKPHNVLVEGDRAFLSDFGLAKALGDSGVLSGASVVGTAEYMSPEQWRGELGRPRRRRLLARLRPLRGADRDRRPIARKEADTEPEMPAGPRRGDRAGRRQGPGRALPERRGADRRRARARRAARPAATAGALGARCGRAARARDACRSAARRPRAARARGCHGAGRWLRAPPASRSSRCSSCSPSSARRRRRPGLGADPDRRPAAADRGRARQRSG